MRLNSSEAFAALADGQNEKALALLHRDDSPGSTFARVRALFRLRSFDRAIAMVEEVDLETLVDEEAQALRALQVFLLARVGRIEQASELLSDACSKLGVHGDLALLEMEYQSAYIAYCVGDITGCERKLENILGQTQMIRKDQRRFAFQSDAYLIRAFAATLLGVVHQLRSGFREMESAHCEALLSAEQSSPRDKFVEALILANLSCLIGNSYSASAVLLLQSRVAQFNWNAGLEEHRVYIKRHLRVAGYLFDPGINAQSAGGRTSPSIGVRLAELVDSLLLDDWGSHEKFQCELSFAIECNSRVDWQALDGEAFTSLIEIVPILSAFDCEQAIESELRYQQKVATLLPHFRNFSVAEQACVPFASACIAKARGDFSAARADYEKSLSMLLSSRILWRASIVALELFTLTRDNALLDIPREYVAAHPFAPFSKRLKRALQLAAQADPGTFIYLKGSITE